MPSFLPSWLIHLRQIVRFMAQAKQILSIAALQHRLGELFKLLQSDIAQPKSNLLQTSDLEALAALNGLDELSGIKQRIMCACVEPGHTAAHHFDFQFARIQ